MSRHKSSKKEKAVALRYQEGTDLAPVVIASGYGVVAQNIVQIAEREGIPVFRDDSAASLMCMLEVGQSIPPELYQAVAVIYAEILKISNSIQSGAPVKQETPTTAKAIQERLAALKRETQK